MRQIFSIAMFILMITGVSYFAIHSLVAQINSDDYFEPAASPPSQFQAPPLHEGEAYQQKAGFLRVNDFWLESGRRWLGLSHAENSLPSKVVTITVRMTNPNVSNDERIAMALCPADYSLIGCSGSRNENADDDRDEGGIAYFGTLPVNARGEDASTAVQNDRAGQIDVKGDVVGATGCRAGTFNSPTFVYAYCLYNK